MHTQRAEIIFQFNGLRCLQELFGRHGDIGRLVLPPTRVLALIEYLEPSEARSAFRGLAYRRLQVQKAAPQR